MTVNEGIYSLPELSGGDEGVFTWSMILDQLFCGDAFEIPNGVRFSIQEAADTPYDERTARAHDDYKVDHDRHEAAKGVPPGFHNIFQSRIPTEYKEIEPEDEEI